jgi:CheY-like chemotaxis protein
VVDDNRDAAALLSLLLRQHDYEVRTTLDGLTALQAALDFRPHVAILDIGLPGMNGYEVAQRMQQEETLHNIVLIAMTGYSQGEDLRRTQEVGFDHHLVKPADFTKLQDILDSIKESRTP